MNDVPVISPADQQPKTSGLAIWSLVLGILGMMCFSLFTGIPGVICGHKALRRIKESGGLLEGKGLAIAGLVTGYLAIAWTIIFVPILASIAIPNFVKARTVAQTNACVNNLRQIASAKAQWAMEKNKKPSDIPTSADLDAYLGAGGFSRLTCPAGGTYTINAGDTDPTCSYSGHALNR